MGFGGRNRLIDSPETFKELTQEYFDWVKANPVMKTITASFQGEISYLKVPHQRPMTQYGLAAHLGVGLSTLKDYGARDGFSAIFKKVTSKMTAWNVDGASSGDLNGNIIARIEGLADKQEVSNTVTVGKDLDDFYADTKAES